MKNLTESVIDPKQIELSKHVFKDGKLIPSVRFKILRGWGQINKIGPTGHVLIVGGIGTLNYTKESDIDITIKWIGPADNFKAAQKTAISLSGKEFAGTHEINYSVQQNIYPDYFDAIYDVITDHWLKGPSEAGINVDRYIQRFEQVASTITTDKAELLSDLTDYRALNHTTNEDRKKIQELIELKLEEIENNISSLGDQYLEIWAARKGAFDEPDINELKEYGRRNALPDNVIYLLLRKYCYLHFLHTIYKISDNGMQKSELDDVEDAYEKFNNCRIAKGFEESLAVLLGSID